MRVIRTLLIGVFVLTASVAQAIPVTDEDLIRMDFDASAFVSTPPGSFRDILQQWDFRFEGSFDDGDWLDLGEGFIVSLFETSSGNLLTTQGYINNGGPTTSLGLGFVGAPLQPTFDGIGYVLFQPTAGSFFNLTLICARVTAAGAGTDNPGCGDLTLVDDDPEPPIGVPEPGTLALLGIGLLGMALARCRRMI